MNTNLQVSFLKYLSTYNDKSLSYYFRILEVFKNAENESISKRSLRAIPIELLKMFIVETCPEHYKSFKWVTLSDNNHFIKAEIQKILCSIDFDSLVGDLLQFVRRLDSEIEPNENESKALLNILNIENFNSGDEEWLNEGIFLFTLSFYFNDLN